MSMLYARTATIVTIANSAYHRSRRELLEGGSRVVASGISGILQISAGARLSESTITGGGNLRILLDLYRQMDSLVFAAVLIFPAAVRDYGLSMRSN